MENIGEIIKEFFEKNPPSERKYVIHTGAGGMELVEERFEEAAGFERIYIGKKVLRILRTRNSRIKKSYLTDRYYKLVRSK